MKTKLRIVKLKNGQYEIEAKWLTWYNFTWRTVSGYDRIVGEGQACMYLAGLVTQYQPRVVVAVIEERTL
jgi:hypothetical protein